uniref:Uncharacterized protein n=1 Tax=Physcomitrium patens TaxID=3218 RepID=A0A2K1JIQ8_PHYPA|nr:hypothetical protein PHYPA_018609 [Physcomitrium patens]
MCVWMLRRSWAQSRGSASSNREWPRRLEGAEAGGVKRDSVFSSTSEASMAKVSDGAQHWMQRWERTA